MVPFQESDRRGCMNFCFPLSLKYCVQIRMWMKVMPATVWNLLETSKGHCNIEGFANILKFPFTYYFWNIWWISYVHSPNRCQKSLHYGALWIYQYLHSWENKSSFFPFQTISVSTLQENPRKQYANQGSDLLSCFWPGYSPKTIQPCLEVLYVNT